MMFKFHKLLIAFWLAASFALHTKAQASFGASSVGAVSVSQNFLITNSQSTVLSILAGKSASTNWSYAPGSTSVWTYPVDLSGVALAGKNGNAMERNLCLITPAYCVTAHHAWTIGGNNGKQVVFTDAAGNNWTNSISQDNVGSSDDIQLVQLASNVPPQIHPFLVLPPNYTNYGASGLAGSYVAWYRNDTGHMNPMAVTSDINSGDTFASGQVDVHFWDGMFATGGDSGSPVFCILDGYAVLIFELHWAGVGGSNLSYPSHFAFLQANCTNQTLNIVNLGGYSMLK